MENEEKINELNEPASNNGKEIRIFKSFDEAEEYGRLQMAKHTPLQRLQYLEAIRKRNFHDALLPDGTWPPLSKKITIIEGTTR